MSTPTCGELSCDECNKRTAALITERDQLRAIFPQICTAIGNGAFCTPTVSVGFIQSIPNEVQLVVAALRTRAERAEADLTAERARLDYFLRWGVTFNSREDIDAAMQEAAK